jgi:predicted O-linked N-acetylglucosamine transferase (SPINDLY family)
MEIFNAPNRQTCVVRRERTNTPLQALVTLNDIQLVEAARNLAQSALKEGGATFVAKSDFIAKRLLARPLNPKEQAIVAKSLSELESFYRANPKEAKMLIAFGESKADDKIAPDKLAAWTMLTNQLMNLDEALNK